MITQDLRYKVFTLKSERKSVREITKETGISRATVSLILKDWKEDEETDQIHIDF